MAFRRDKTNFITRVVGFVHERRIDQICKILTVGACG